MKWHFMKRRELLEFLTYLPWSLRNKLLKKEEWKWDTLYAQNYPFNDFKNRKMGPLSGQFSHSFLA